MHRNEVALAAELNDRHGVTTTARLARLGISEQMLRTLVASGRILRVVRGVYAAAAWPDSLEHRMAIACAATGGTVCFPTAGQVWELRKTPRPPEVHVAITEGCRIDPVPDVVIHRTYQLLECDVVRRPDGIAVTTPPRTTFDAAWWLDDDDYESLVEDGLRRYFTLVTLRTVGARLRQRGRRGSKRFRETLARRDPTLRPVDSNDELRLERALRRRGFPKLTRQCRLELATGAVIHPDLGIPKVGFYIEVDHRTWHAGSVDADYDCRRDLEVEALGHRVQRVTDIAIDRHLDRTVEALWSIYQRHLRSRTVAEQRSRSAEREGGGSDFRG